MSIQPEKLESLAQFYYEIYGSDIRVDLDNARSSTAFSLDIKNGDYDIVGVTPGNKFSDIKNLITQRFLSILYTPFDGSNFNSSSRFLQYAKSSGNMTREQKKQLLTAEIILTASKIPQINSITHINISDHQSDASRLLIDITFNLITGEDIEIPLEGVA